MVNYQTLPIWEKIDYIENLILDWISGRELESLRIKWTTICEKCDATNFNVFIERTVIML